MTLIGALYHIMTSGGARTLESAVLLPHGLARLGVLALLDVELLLQVTNALLKLMDHPLATCGRCMTSQWA